MTPNLINPLNGQPINISDLENVLQGEYLNMSFGYNAMRASMRVILRIHPVLSTHYEEKFYLKEKMIRSTAQRRALRVAGLYLVDRIDVCFQV